MKVRKIEEGDFSALLAFNKEVYKNRDQIEESLNYRLHYNPLSDHLPSESMIAIDENDGIIGQILMMPTQFKYAGKINPAYWGMDYIVDDAHRGSPAGTVLCKKALKMKTHFGVGLAETSLAIHKVFGERIIGSVHKYIKPMGPFSLMRFLFRNESAKKDIKKLPDEIYLKNIHFKRVYEPHQIHSDDGFWYQDRLEFCRNADFLKWRYFYYPDKYFVFRRVDQNKRGDTNSLTTFFVTKPILWKGVNCLLLVDYRVTSEEDFAAVIQASTVLGRKLKSAALITGCSLPELAGVLSRNFFWKFGNSMDIVSNCSNIQIQDRILVTFGDSDCEFYYGNGKW